MVLASGPLAYWPLDEASGSAIDASGHGHNGIAVGQPGYRSKSLLPNQRGFAVDLSSGSRFFVPPFPKFSDSSTGYTIAYWIMLAGPGGTYTQVVGDGVAGEQFYLMNYLHFDGRLLCPRPHYGANQGSWDPDPCTVGANLTEEVGADMSLTVGANLNADIRGAMATRVVGNVTESAGKNIVLDAGKIEKALNELG